MKKQLSIFLLIVMLLPNIAYAENINEEKIESKIEDSLNVRNQDIFVHTKDGVQRATLSEANKIAELKKLPMTDLTKSYILGDYKSGKILESYNIDEVRGMASTSKLVSIFVVYDEIKKGNISKDDIVTIDHECSSLIGSSYKLKENDQKKVSELIEASLIVSANDAITALAKHISGSKEAFVDRMNEKCQELGLKNAHMVNPTGLTDYSIEDYNKMTTREMFILTRQLINEYPEILKITQKDKLSDDSRDFLEYNTNPILGIVDDIDGLKTGYTNAAGRCLIATGLSKGVEGKTIDTRLIGITTGSTNDLKRYVAARELMENGLKDYKYIIIGNPDKPVTKIKVEDAVEKEIDVYEVASSSVLWNSKSKIDKNIKLKENLKAPLAAGEVVGSISFSLNGEEISEQDLIVKDRVAQKGILNKIIYIYQDIFRNIEKAG